MIVMKKHNVFYFIFGMREIIKGFLIMARTFSNWYDFALIRSGAVSHAVLLNRNRRLNLRSIGIDRKTSLISLDYRGKTMLFHFGSTRQLDNAMRNIYQTFIMEQYKELDVKSRRVVDIGANNGDSALCFAFEGASKVYAYEPYPKMFSIAERNIKLNGMGKIIELKNMAVLGKSGDMRVDGDYESVSNTMLENSSTGRRIRVEGIDSIVKRYKLKHAALKVDCEGSEYEIMLKASIESLKRFDTIAIEYHFGYEELVKKLRASGFKVRHTQPKIGRNAETNGLRMVYGMVYAHR